MDAPGNPSLTKLRTGLQSVGNFFATQRHLIAVRDGVVGALPLVLVGSIFLLISQAPWMTRPELQPYVALLLIPYRMLGGAIALYVTFATAYSLARHYALDPLACGLLSLAAYLVAAFPFAADPSAPPSLPVARIGAGGIFAGILLAIFATEVTRFFVRRNWTLRMPGKAPETIVRSFVAVLPTLAVITAVFAFTQLIRFDLIQLLQDAVKPLLSATGSLPSVLSVTSVDSALWVLGVHASAALATLRPFWESMLIQNADAAVQHAPLPHIAPLPFYQWFIWQGGSGATLSLALHLLRAKSTQLRAIGRAGIVPALFNVNEPIVFGLPIVLNPTLALPFFLVPALSGICAYAALSLEWVHRPYLELPWVLPAPIGAFLSTGGDVRAVALELFNLALGFVVYLPFIRRYDARLLAQESATKPSGASANGGSSVPSGA